MAGFEDTAFAVVQNLDCGNQCLMLILLVVLLDDDGFRRGGLINEAILPFPCFAVLVKRSVDRFVAAEASIHVNDILVGDIEVLCD